MSLHFNFSLFFKLALLFLCVQILGTLTAFWLLPSQSLLGIQQYDLGQSSVQDITVASLYSIALWLLIILTFVILTLRFRRLGYWIYRIILSAIILSGIQVVMWSLHPTLSLPLAFAAIVLFWTVRRVWMHNIIMVLTLAGLGAMIGLSLMPSTAVVALVVLSFYDIVAVYKTGHMLKLAEMMIEARSIFGFIIPEAPHRHIQERVHEVRTGSGFMILGSGDVVLPLILAVSLIRISLLQSVVVSIFSLLGLLFMQLIFQNQGTRRPMAALPPIAVLSIIGYLVTFLF